LCVFHENLCSCKGGKLNIVNLEREAIDFIKESCNFDETIVMFSGGKDSLVAMDLAKKAGLNHAVYINSELEYTISRSYVEKMKKYYFIEDLKPENDFFEFCNLLSPPSKRLKWCCKVLKLVTSMKYSIKNKKYYHITGIRGDESLRRSKYDKITSDPLLFANPRYHFYEVNPVFDWSEKDIWRYIRYNNLKFNPLYRYINRVGCWCCPFCTKNEWDLARALEPEGFQKFKKILNVYSDSNVTAEYRRKYIKNGWRSHAFKYSKVPVIKMSNDSKHYTLKGDNIYLKKVENLLFILASNYSINDNELTFTLEMNLQNQQIRLLLEKCLNCVGCGVCTVLCPVNALYPDDSKTITVNKDLCVGCLACCKQIDSKLKMGCIARNYKKERLSIVF
jgi:phosphoadenosine phosphosulfate reductase